MEKRGKIVNLILAILIILISIANVNIIFQNDTFFSIAVGRQIEEVGIDMLDHLTWHGDLNYTYSHWLYDILNYNLYKNFGFWAIFLCTLCISAIIGLILYKVLQKVCKGDRVIAFAFAAVMIWLSSGYFTSRAQIISYPLFILEVYFIEELLKTNKKKYIIGLIIIPLIIANCHAALWPLYFVLYMPYIAEEIINKILGKIRKSPKDENNKVICEGFKYTKTLIVVLFLAIFTGFCTPIGSTPFTYMFKTMGDGVSSQNIMELQPATIPTDARYSVFAIFFVITLISSKIKIRLSDLFMILGLMILPFFGIRSTIYLLLIGSIPLTRTVIYCLKDKDLNILDKELVRISNEHKVFFAIPIFCVIVSIALSAYEYNKGKSFVDKAGYPVDACEYILENIDLTTAKIYNGFNYGSYMEFKGIPVYMDSRSEMYTRAYNDVDIFQDFVDVKSGKITYKDIVEKYSISHLLIPKDNWIINYIKLDKDYKTIYEDEYFILFEVLRKSAV